jgi:UDP-glucose 4-epimerase
MNILVTGGSGFIGSHIVDQLLEKRHGVTIYDIDTPKYKQICQFVRGDILDLQRLTRSTEGVDVIYNLAAEANVDRFYESPLHSSAVTTQGVLNVMEAARVNKVRRVIQASTEWVYGTLDSAEPDLATEETHYAKKPDHLYTSSKIAAELFIRGYEKLHNVEYTILRYGIPFGERARPETVTPIFLKSLLEGREIRIHGDGSQTRQFIYVKDLACGNVACLLDAARNEVFNINGAEKVSVLDIVRTLEKILNKRAKIKFLEDRVGNYKGRYVSSEKADRLLGWRPRMKYKEAMEHYVKWFISNEIGNGRP